MALTAKQERFVAEYLVDLNATQAAIRAGYSERTAKQQGSRLLTNADVAAAIGAGVAARAERTRLSADAVVERLGVLAFAEIGDFVAFGGEKVLLKASPDLATTAPVAAVSSGRSGVRLRMHDPIRALELLGKHLGLFAGDGLPDGPIEVKLVWPEQAE